jgi:VCBS repeat-containing protein
MGTTTTKGMSVSIKLTPQAQNDVLTFDENQVTGSGVGTATTADLLANDGGGAAARIWGLFNRTEAQVQSSLSTLANTPMTSTSFVLTNGGVPTGTVNFSNGNITFDAIGDYNHLGVGQSANMGSFTYLIRLANGTFSTATVNIVISGSNDGPVAVADIASGTENQPLTIDVLANDKDVDQNATKELVSVTAPTGQGSASVVDGKVVFNPGTDFDHLKAGATTTVTLNYTMKDDQGATSSSTVTITITGTNDGASITGSTTGAVTEAGGAGAGVSSASGQLTVSDVDDGEAAFTAPTPAALQGVYGAFSFNAATGAWSYALDNAAADSLNEGDSVEETLTVTSLDGTATETITVTITGSNDAATITGTNTDSVTEAGAAGPGDASASGQLTVSDVDDGEDAFTAPAPAALQGVYGAFSFNAATGAWSYALDNAAADSLNEGDSVEETLTVTSLDGTATETITVTITGSNDAATITGTNTDSVTEAGAAGPGDASASGQLTVSDVDDGEDAFTAPTPAALQGVYGAFSFNAATGAWSYALDNAAATA